VVGAVAVVPGLLSGEAPAWPGEGLLVQRPCMTSWRYYARHKVARVVFLDQTASVWRALSRRYTSGQHVRQAWWWTGSAASMPTRGPRCMAVLPVCQPGAPSAWQCCQCANQGPPVHGCAASMPTRPPQCMAVLPVCQPGAPGAWQFCQYAEQGPPVHGSAASLPTRGPRCMAVLPVCRPGAPGAWQQPQLQCGCRQRHASMPGLQQATRYGPGTCTAPRKLFNSIAKCPEMRPPSDTL
jgi:hypothetical protein